MTIATKIRIGLKKLQSRSLVAPRPNHTTATLTRKIVNFVESAEAGNGTEQPHPYPKGTPLQDAIKSSKEIVGYLDTFETKYDQNKSVGDPADLSLEGINQSFDEFVKHNSQLAERKRERIKRAGGVENAVKSAKGSYLKRAGLISGGILTALAVAGVVSGSMGGALLIGIPTAFSLAGHTMANTFEVGDATRSHFESLESAATRAENAAKRQLELQSFTQSWADLPKPN